MKMIIEPSCSYFNIWRIPSLVIAQNVGKTNFFYHGLKWRISVLIVASGSLRDREIIGFSFCSLIEDYSFFQLSLAIILDLDQRCSLPCVRRYWSCSSLQHHLDWAYLWHLNISWEKRSRKIQNKYMNYAWSIIKISPSYL